MKSPVIRRARFFWNLWWSLATIEAVGTFLITIHAHAITAVYSPRVAMIQVLSWINIHTKVRNGENKWLIVDQKKFCKLSLLGAFVFIVLFLFYFILSLSKVKDNWRGQVRSVCKIKKVMSKIDEKYVSCCFDCEAQVEKSVMRPTEKITQCINHKIAVTLWPRY